MAEQTYQLVGSQDPTSRIDKVLVEGPSEDYPEGKVLHLHGQPEPLDQEQYAILSQFVRLLPVKPEAEPETRYIDQPGVERPSLSTNRPADPGTAPNVDSLTKAQLEAELARVQAEGHLQDVDPKSNKEELQKALRRHHGQEA